MFALDLESPSTSIQSPSPVSSWYCSRKANILRASYDMAKYSSVQIWQTSERHETEGVAQYCTSWWEAMCKLSSISKCSRTIIWCCRTNERPFLPLHHGRILWSIFQPAPDDALVYMYLYIFAIFIKRYGGVETSIRQEQHWWSGTCRAGTSRIGGIVSSPLVKQESKTKQFDGEERLYATSIVSRRGADMTVSICFLMWCHSWRNISFSDGFVY